MAPSKTKEASVDKEILVRKRRWNAKAKSGKWGDWEVLLRRSQVVAVAAQQQNSTNAAVASRTRSSRKRQAPTLTSATTSFSLPLGGTFNVYPNLLSSERQQDLTEELLRENPHLFRQYRIQGGPEPRAHFLLHEHATHDDFDSSEQPGYKYGTITMKARPLSLLPKLEGLATEMQGLTNVEGWNVGINPVFYRDCRDHIGLHSDNDQGEDKILTILIKSPETPRRVVIQTCPKKGTKKRQDGDEQFELNMGAGDAYDMDGEMQQHYVHGVPSDNPGKDGRLAIVLRHGNFCKYTRDSGQALDNVEPRVVIPRMFGHVKGLTEGDSYSREQIRELGAHRSPQGGISGNKTDGCDAIIVSGSRDDGLGEDRFDRLMYAAETKVGAGSILISMAHTKPIRVFRSSAAVENPYRALLSKGRPTQYRYDGQYRVSSVAYFDEAGMERTETPDKVSPAVPGPIYQFQFERIKVGTDASSNHKSFDQLLEYSIANNTLGPEALSARVRDATLEWPMPTVLISQPQTTTVTSTEPSQDHAVGLRPPQERVAPFADAVRSGPPQERVAPFTADLDDNLDGNTNGQGLAQFYAHFPTPAFENESRLVSPPVFEPSTAFRACSMVGQPGAQEYEAAKIMQTMGALEAPVTVQNDSTLSKERGQSGGVASTSTSSYSLTMSQNESTLLEEYEQQGSRLSLGSLPAYLPTTISQHTEEALVAHFMAHYDAEGTLINPPDSQLPFDNPRNNVLTECLSVHGIEKTHELFAWH